MRTLELCYIPSSPRKYSGLRINFISSIQSFEFPLRKSQFHIYYPALSFSNKKFEHDVKISCSRSLYLKIRNKIELLIQIKFYAKIVKCFFNNNKNSATTKTYHVE